MGRRTGLVRILGRGALAAPVVGGLLALTAAGPAGAATVKKVTVASTHANVTQIKSVGPKTVTGLTPLNVSVPVGLPPAGIALDSAHHTAYVISSGPNASQISVIDTATCSVTSTSKCTPVTTIPLNRGPGQVANPVAVAYDSVNRNVYIVDQAAAGDLSAFDATSCSATSTLGCTTPTILSTGPTTPGGNGFITPTGLAIDTSTPAPGAQFNAVYVTDNTGGTVTIFNGATCSANVTTGCGAATSIAPAGTTTTAPNFGPIYVDPAANTVYVGDIANGAIYTLPEATCSAAASAATCTFGTALTLTTGTGPGPSGVTPSAFTSAGTTLYMADSGNNAVFLIDTTKFNATTVGANLVVPFLAVGMTPSALALDASGAVLVANRGDGTISEFDSTVCNATSTPTATNCNVTTTTVGSKSALVGLAIDATTSPATVFALDFNSSSVLVLSVAVPTPPVAVPTYQLAGSNGRVATFTVGSNPTFSNPIPNLNKPIVGIATTATGMGYYLVASDGGVFTSGDAVFYGSEGSRKLNKPILGITLTPSGKGYWLVASDGGVFSEGDAVFHGSTGSLTLNKPVVGIAASPTGYWLAASDGGVFSFNSVFYGSEGSLRLNKPMVGIAAAADGKGYTMVAADGGVFNHGSSVFYGSTGSLKLAKPIVGIATAPGGGGYWFFASDGGVFSYGPNAPFAGSIPGTGVNFGAPVVGGAAQ